MPTLQIRPDIRAEYSSLFGPKTVNGRTVVVEDVIARLTDAVGGELPQLLAERLAFQDRVGQKTARYTFLPAGEKVSDADGNQTTVAAIRRACSTGSSAGRLPEAWRVGATVPIPPDTMTARARGDRAVHRPRDGDGRAQQRCVAVDVGLGRRGRRLQGPALPGVDQPEQILAHEWDGKPFVHPTKKRDLYDRRPAGEVADDLPPRGGSAPAQSTDDAER